MASKGWYLLAFFLGFLGIVGIIIIAVVGYLKFRNIKEVLKLAAVSFIGMLVSVIITNIIAYLWMKSFINNMQSEVVRSISHMQNSTPHSRP